MQDLCARCAQELLLAPLDNLSDALLAVRALRATLASVVVELVEVKQLVYQLAGATADGELKIEVPGGIWTPE